jgi:hypothetical protein
MISTRTANRLDTLAKEKGISVIICSSTKPSRRWYSVGNKHGGQWHQITGFTDAPSVEEFINKFGVK